MGQCGAENNTAQEKGISGQEEKKVKVKKEARSVAGRVTFSRSLPKYWKAIMLRRRRRNEKGPSYVDMYVAAFHFFAPSHLAAHRSAVR